MLKENKFEELAAIILKEYYDPLYKHSVDAIKYNLVVEKNHVHEIKKFLGKI